MNRIHHRRPASGPHLTRTGAVIGMTALTLAAAAAANAYQTRRAERRNPPVGRFVDVDGVRLHYLEKGDGPPVVLLHGNIVSAQDFVYSGLFDRLAARYRVIAIERPGFGYSERPRGTAWTPRAQADLLSRAFDVLGAEQPLVLGHSWGALVAAALALDHPEAVRGLVLLGGYYYPTARADVVLTGPPALPVVGDLFCHTVSPLVGAALMPVFIKGMFTPQQVPARFSRSFSTGMALRPSQLQAMSRDGAMMAAAASGLQHRYGELRMPLAIIAGAGDKVADIDRQSKRLHEEVRHSSLRLIQDAGHMVHYAVPDEVAAAVDEVAARTGHRARLGATETVLGRSAALT